MDCSMFFKCQFLYVLFSSFFFLERTNYGQAKPLQDKQRQNDDINNSKLLEGDIIMDETVWGLYTSQNMATEDKRGVVTNNILLWPGGIVPYTINIYLGSRARKTISDAIAELNIKTCIRFKPRSNEYSYVEFIKGRGCCSYVGRQSGRQVISLGSGCEDKGIALHEMLHALGFFHTSSRTDRDAYVIVNEHNVATGYLGNFHRYSHGQIDHLGAPYDLTSVMHLPRDAFAKRRGLYTIVARAGNDTVLGQRVGLSPVDNYQINALYNCPSRYRCSSAFGLESRKITDKAMTASSSRFLAYPSQGRLHNTASSQGIGAWCPNHKQGSWIRIDLGKDVHVTGIATQGLVSYFPLFKKEFIVKYEVWYRRSYAHYWNIYRSSSGAYSSTKNLPGNWDATSVQYNALMPTFNARYVEIIPRSWIGSPCVRIEIYGCKV